MINPPHAKADSAEIKAALAARKVAAKAYAAAVRHYDSVPARDEVEKEVAFFYLGKATDALKAARAECLRIGNRIATENFNRHFNTLAR